MVQYKSNLKQKAITLRKQGKTYSEIQKNIHINIPKSTLSTWFKGIVLSKNQQKRIDSIILKKLASARVLSVKKREKIKIQEKIRLENKYKYLEKKILNKDTALIAFALLCFGEASKTNTNKGSFYLGSSNPQIIKLFIGLLKKCFPFNESKIRCTVQCRADQNQKQLVDYWHKQTKVPKKLFYKTRVDPRTKGIPTKNKSYKGVLRVDYFDAQVPKTLEVLYNFLSESVWKDYLGR